MKLQQFVAGAGIPASMPGRYASGEAWSAPARQAAAGLGQISAQAADAYGGMVRERDRIEAKKRAAAATIEANRVHADLEVEIAEIPSLLQTETDPDAYKAKHQMLLEEKRKSVADRVKYPDAAKLLEPRLPAIFGNAQVKALHHADKLYTAANTAALDRTTEAQKQLAGQAPLDGDEEWLGRLRDGLRAINDGERFVGAVDADRRRRVFRREMYYERAVRDVQEDPSGFLGRAPTTYRDMDPDQRNQLVTAARNEIDQRQVRAAAEERRIDAEVEKHRKMAVEDVERQLVDLIYSDRATDRDIDAVKHLLSSEKLALYRKLKEERGEASERSGTPEIVQHYSKEVYSANAKVNEGYRTRLMAEIAKTLPHHLGKHKAEFLKHLQGMVKSPGEDKTAEQYLERRHRDIERAIPETLRTKALMGPEFDAVANQVIAQANDELRRESVYFGGEIDPAEWWQRRRPYYVAQVADAAGTRLGVLRRQLVYPDAKTLLANRATFKDRDADYYDQARILKEIVETEREVNRLRGLGGRPSPQAPQAAPALPAAPAPAPAKQMGRTAK